MQLPEKELRVLVRVFCHRYLRYMDPLWSTEDLMQEARLVAWELRTCVDAYQATAVKNRLLSILNHSILDARNHQRSASKVAGAVYFRPNREDSTEDEQSVGEVVTRFVRAPTPSPEESASAAEQVMAALAPCPPPKTMTPGQQSLWRMRRSRAKRALQKSMPPELFWRLTGAVWRASQAKKEGR